MTFPIFHYDKDTAEPIHSMERPASAIKTRHSLSAVVISPVANGVEPMDVDRSSQKAEVEDDDDEEEQEEEDEASDASESQSSAVEQKEKPTIKRKLIPSPLESGKVSKMRVDDIVDDAISASPLPEPTVRILSGRTPAKVDTILKNLKERFKYLCHVVDKVDRKVTGVNILHAAIKVVNGWNITTGYSYDIYKLFQSALDRINRGQDMKEVIKYVEAVHQRKK